MTNIIQEKIKKEAEGYGKLAPAFLEGDEFTLDNQWISVEEDLPYNHEELLLYDNITREVFVRKKNGEYDISFMFYFIKWEFIIGLENVTHWMPFPKAPKELNQLTTQN